MTIAELRQMTDEHLFAYFCENARYYKEAPPKTKYSIQVAASGRALFSHDTADLREKFFAAVRGQHAP